MRATPRSSRTLFFLVLGGIAAVFVVGRLWMSGPSGRERTEAGIVSLPVAGAAARAAVTE